MQRLRPAAIIEFTATPDNNSNVLYKVSASELKAEDMIKLPVRLAEHQSWEDAITNAMQGRYHMQHMQWLVETGQKIKTADGKVADVWHLQHSKDSKMLSAWAKHFRNQYCLDNEIDIMRKGTMLSRAEYLSQIKLPDARKAPGPSIRAGDFGEILVADYLEFILNYWVPRTRYSNKTVRNESAKGSDTIGFKILNEDCESPNDILAVFEVKAQLSGNTHKPRVQDAVDGSAIDHIRLAESLNAIKQRFLDKGLIGEMGKIERFQNHEDHPYKEVYGAVAIFSTSCFDVTNIATTTTSKHPNVSKLILLVIHGNELMELTHELYRRAADEA